MEDPRKIALKRGLRQLTTAQIEKVLAWPADRLLLDTYNYHAGCFCPLAVAEDLPTTLVDPTNEKVIAALEAQGYSVFNTRGVVGTFFTNNRLQDMITAAREVQAERG